MVTADTVGTWLLGNRCLADAGASRAERVCLAAAQPSADLASGSNRQAPDRWCAVVRIQESNISFGSKMRRGRCPEPQVRNRRFALDLHRCAKMEDVAGTENVMALRQLASLTLSDEVRAEQVADDAAEDGSGAGAASADRADLRGRRSEQGSGGQAGP